VTAMINQVVKRARLCT